MRKSSWILGGAAPLRRFSSLLVLASLLILSACGGLQGVIDEPVDLLELRVVSEIEPSVVETKLDGAKVSGTVTVSLGAPFTVSEAFFYLDGSAVPVWSGVGGSISFEMDTYSLEDGVHILHAEVWPGTGVEEPMQVEATFEVVNEHDVDPGPGPDPDPAPGPDPAPDPDPAPSPEPEPGPGPVPSPAPKPGPEQPVLPPPAAPELPEATLYVSALSGNDSNSGRSVDAPLRSIQRAAELVRPGDVVYLRGGVYPIQVRFTRSGTRQAPIVWTSYPGEWAILDGSNRTPVQDSDRMWVMDVSWNVFMNFEVRHGPQDGIHVSRSHDNVFSRLVTRENHYSGISNLNSDRNRYEYILTYGNYDRYNPYGVPGDGADGIAISTGDRNVLYRVVAFQNSDDGIDTWRSTNTLVESSIAFDNGQGSHGNGNGIKAGGNNDWVNTIVRDSIAFHNRSQGITDNSGRGVTFVNNTSFDNGGYTFVAGEHTTLINNISVGGRGAGMWGSTSSHNTWDLRISNPGFLSTDPESDDFLTLGPSSPAIGAGVAHALSNSTDLGAIPFGTSYAQLRQPMESAVAWAAAITGTMASAVYGR